MMKHIPKGGYAYSNKAKYRESVWKHLSETINTETAHILLLPARREFEIVTVLNLGFKEQNIHIVDLKPAWVSPLSRKFKHIHTYGKGLIDAFQRLQKQRISLQCANFDLCNDVSEAELILLRTLAETGVMADGSRISLNVLRGRTNCPFMRDLAELEDITPHHDPYIKTPLDMVRVSMIPLSFDTVYDTREVYYESYKTNSGNQTMLWTIHELRKRYAKTKGTHKEQSIRHGLNERNLAA